MLQLHSYFSNPKIKKIIIILSVSTIAIQTLFFIQSYAVNTLFWDDWDFVPIIKAFYHGDPFWQYPGSFLQHNEHRTIFPFLILFASVVLDSWNSIHLMYFGWCLLVVDTLIIYLMLNKSDSKLKWLIIPITAFLFNTSQIETLLWGFTSVVVFLTVTGVISSLYFLNREKSHERELILAIVFAIIASFSEIQGLMIWIVGLFSLFHKEKMRRTYLITWISTAIAVYVLYFTNYMFFNKFGKLGLSSFNIDTLKFFLLYLSNGLLKINVESVQIILGSLVVSLVIGGTIYLWFSKIESKKTLPWIQFGFFGLLCALITALGRQGIGGPTAPRYIPLSNFALISSLVIATIIFMQIYGRSTHIHKRTVLVIIFASFLAILIIPIINSYNLGWTDGYAFFVSNSLSMKCLNDPLYDLKCSYLFPVTEWSSKNVMMLKQLKLGPFATINETSYGLDPLLDDNNWKNMTNNLAALVNVDFINSPDMPNTGNTVFFTAEKNPFITTSGWAALKDDTDKADAVYFLIDGKIDGKVLYGTLRPDVSKAYSNKITKFAGWSYAVDLRQISKECHTLSLRIVKGNHYAEVPITKLCLT